MDRLFPIRPRRPPTWRRSAPFFGATRLVAQLFDRIGHSLADLDRLDALIEVFRRFRAFAVTEPGVHRLLFDRTVDAPPLSTSSARERDEAIGLVAAVVAGAIDAGALLPTEPSDATRRLLATAIGSIQLELTGCVDRVGEEAFEAAMATSLRGLRPSVQGR